jgi:selenocysteine lyase/cysteine desulfurase
MFNPKESFGSVPAGASPVPKHGADWKHKFANWWGGATIASPTMEVAGPAKQAVNAVRRFFDEPHQLNAYYLQDMEYSRFLIRQLLNLDSRTPVVFDASGTSAILLASRLCAHVGADDGGFFTITTDEGGSLVPAALKGRNPNEMEATMFQPTSALFYQAEPVLPYPSAIAPTSKVIGISRLTNGELVDVIKEAARSLSEGGRISGCLVLPHVTKTGRILPIKAVSRAVEELKAEGIQLFYIIDDIQGIGRMDAESINNPVSFCDAYLFGSSKALGGLLIASTLVLKRDLLEAFTERAESGFMSADPAWISHFQFEPEYESRFPRYLFKPGAVSIPEVVAMREAVRLHIWRGVGETYSERRQHQLTVVAKQRRQVVEALFAIPGIEVLESTADRPLVPSIICFKVPDSWSPNAFKQAMQESHPIVTPSACIGRYVRLDIPEYRSMPSIEVLVKTIRGVIASKE